MTGIKIKGLPLTEDENGETNKVVCIHKSHPQDMPKRMRRILNKYVNNTSKFLSGWPNHRL